MHNRKDIPARLEMERDDQYFVYGLDEDYLDGIGLWTAAGHCKPVDVS